MFIVLDIRYSLAQVAIWADARRVEAVLDLAQELFDDRHSVLANHNSFHFVWLNLIVPFMGAYIVHIKSLRWISV